MRAGIPVSLAFAAAAFCAAAGTTTPAPTSTTRPATADERAYCTLHLADIGPASGDCSRLPLTGEISEDDPWDRWDCRIMGDHICASTIYFVMADGSIQAYDVNAPDRPGCFVEPSQTAEGFEVVFRPDIAIGDELGFEVPCRGIPTA